ncbi:hypothetical protein XM38_029850 [Halomicronema hongdechloris C2206]|uniref:Uncharacterized protein n=1 Tax=Halomicronema hongdechloris C2206 TaxID=1641165 RepID=A0A1Z3HP11_9CYAN|nr:hypothetical protein [Halomicronema hongdechloris]ASC72031.1 hypothetical protein XM38_029850 [Halomicronema hongdechloris C2206]
MKRLVYALLTAALATAALAPAAAAVDWDKLRRENLDKDQNSLDTLRTEHLELKVDWDKLRRENLDKD